MIVVTTNEVPGYEIVEVLGLVVGNTVRSKHLGKDIGAFFKTLAGGEIKAYTEMLTESRNIAIQRMIDEAEKMGADAIIGVRLGSSSVMSGAAEMLAYGTAVKIKKKGERT
ncbi:MAG: YbjQ family protein [Candidatus Syntropharchaeia archaeon]